MKKFLGFCMVMVLLVLAGKYVWENQPHLIPEEVREKIEELFENGEKLLQDGEGLVDGALNSYQGFEGYDIEDANSFNDEYPVESGDFEQVYEALTADNLDVELGGCTLVIQQASDGILRIQAQNVGKFQAYEEEGTFHVKATRKAVEDTVECKIVLYLPQYCWKEAKIELGAGLVQISMLEADSLGLEVGAGKLEADGISAKKLQVSVGAGAASLQNIAAGRLTAKVDAGSLTVQGNVTHTIDADCSVGNMELALAGEEKDYNYTIDCVAGSVYLNAEKYTTELGKETKLDYDALKEMELSCAVGNIRITFAE